ncbi:MAG: hypothetical protein MJA27_09785 [Pseudanabaenales cyanobacterium]|nr:hypothetical protein [Pseudanabaenales cyanobacterium]
MPAAKNPNPVDKLFEHAEKALQTYQTDREGKLIVDCKRLPNDGRAPGFKVFLPGSPYSSFCFTPKELEHYMSYRQSQTFISQVEKPLYRVEEPLHYLEQSVIEILRKTGYGSVVLEFKQGKKQQTTFLCSVTVSHLGRILPEM